MLLWSANSGWARKDLPGADFAASEHAVLAVPPVQRYQTGAIGLISRARETEAEFIDMVSRCNVAGVQVYADAVINHMTPASGTGSAGSGLHQYGYPTCRTSRDFHSACTVSNYLDEANVRTASCSDCGP